MTLFFIITGIFILASATIVVILLVRAWPRLTLLDVDNLPEVKESQKKDEILRRRAEKTQAQVGEKTDNFWQAIKHGSISGWQTTQSSFRKYVDVLERTLLDYGRKKKAKLIDPDDELTRQRQLRDLFFEAETALTAHAYDAAEKAYIAAISVDEKNVRAYQGLGDVYFAEKHLSEARETYQFVLHLDKNNEHALVCLAELAEAEGSLETAVEYYQQAVLINDSLSARFFKLYELLSQLKQPETALTAIQEALAIEPLNPKYLDNFIEASILVGNKTLAEEGYRELRMVNPDNQKLPLFRDRIDNLA